MAKVPSARTARSAGRDAWRVSRRMARGLGHRGARADERPPPILNGGVRSKAGSGDVTAQSDEGVVTRGPRGSLGARRVRE
jgi:hypothetical protein